MCEAWGKWSYAHSNVMIISSHCQGRSTMDILLILKLVMQYHQLWMCVPFDMFLHKEIFNWTLWCNMIEHLNSGTKRTLIKYLQFCSFTSKAQYNHETVVCTYMVVKKIFLVLPFQNCTSNVSFQMWKLIDQLHSVYIIFAAMYRILTTMFTTFQIKRNNNIYKIVHNEKESVVEERAKIEKTLSKNTAMQLDIPIQNDLWRVT